MTPRTFLLTGLLSLFSVSLFAQSSGSDIEWITWTDKTPHQSLIISPNGKYIATTNLSTFANQEIRIYSTEESELGLGGELQNTIPYSKVVESFNAIHGIYTTFGFLSDESLFVSQRIYDTILRNYRQVLVQTNLEGKLIGEFQTAFSSSNPTSDVYTKGLYIFSGNITSTTPYVDSLLVTSLLSNQTTTFHNRYDIGTEGRTVLIGVSADASVIALRQRNHYWIGEVASGKVLAEHEFNSYYDTWRDIRLLPDNRSLLIVGIDNTVRTMNVETGELKRIIVSGDLQTYGNSTPQVALSPNGRYLAISQGNGVIHLWDVRTGEKKHTYRDYQGVFSAIEFTPDGQHLIGLTLDGALLSYKGPDHVASIEDQEQLQANRLELINSSTFNAHSHTARFTFTLPEQADVRISIYNLQGEVIGEVVKPSLQRGEHVVEWQQGDLPSGVYFYRLAAGNKLATGRLIVTR
ncbi:MAG: T9SS type A sorting domain-containing protein [Ignavibacteriae bacterium]|nr:T9SS type A sorting domain-containing protein [Ignavibacteriota bacterium]MCB9215130.1 T9SS type A sorting domain-containing protein [Ignavibacteria bacterium]